jgi:hypothetical protein
MTFKRLCTLWLATAAVSVLAQTPAETAEGVEDAVPPPTRYSTEKLIPIEMPRYVTLAVGIDPDSVSVAADGVIRYVVVMRNATGSLNIAYEGISCVRGEVRTYARINSNGNWVSPASARWLALTANHASKHALAIAQQGLCDEPVRPQRENILNALKRRERSHL